MGWYSNAKFSSSFKVNCLFFGRSLWKKISYEYHNLYDIVRTAQKEIPKLKQGHMDPDGMSRVDKQNKLYLFNNKPCGHITGKCIISIKL